mmetsp:Transcript_23678/g.39078  ORF Transcript_23678/g.39078 Transcript_23678/m.39078 type:complete len:196 (+) Transcript_23678:22-609(+)
MDHVHVCLLDGRQEKRASSRLIVAAQSLLSSWAHVGDCTIEVHVMLPNATLYSKVPDAQGHFSMHELRLPAHLVQVYESLTALTEGPGSHYLYKPLIPWLLPWLTHCIVLDPDVVFLQSPCELWAVFRLAFEQHTFAIGLTEDVAGRILYPGCKMKPNGGILALLASSVTRRSTHISACHFLSCFTAYRADGIGN